MSGKGESKLYPKQTRRDQMVQEFEHDPYHTKLKLKEPTVCRNCAAVFKRGRWSWDSVTDDVKAKAVTCPACQRVADKLPAGFVEISQEYLGERKEEMLNLIHRIEREQRQAHPMKRLMDIESDDKVMQITSTDPRLARNIGDALKNAYGGKLDYHYTAGEFMLRVKLGR